MFSVTSAADVSAVAAMLGPFMPLLATELFRFAAAEDDEVPLVFSCSEELLTAVSRPL